MGQRNGRLQAEVRGVIGVEAGLWVLNVPSKQLKCLSYLTFFIAEWDPRVSVCTCMPYFQLYGDKHSSSYRLFRPANQDSILVKQAVYVSVIKYLKREKWFLHPFVVANKVRNDPHPAKTATMSTAWVLCNAHGSYCMSRKGGIGCHPLFCWHSSCHVQYAAPCGWHHPPCPVPPTTSTTPHNLSLIPRPSMFFFVFSLCDNTQKWEE